MRHICKKLKNRGGASIIFALLIFLLCALVGASALTAASANIGRYSHLEDDQQKYLSVSSAIDLLRGQLGEQTLTAELTLTETYKWNYDADSKLAYTTTYELDDSTLTGPTGWMEKFNGTFKGVFENKYVPSDFFNKPDAGGTSTNTTRPAAVLPESPDVIFTVSGAGGLSGKVDDVTVKVSLDGETFDLLFSFYVGDGTDKAHVATMRAPATVTPEGPVESVTQSETADVSGQRVTNTTAKVSVVWRADDTVVVRDTNG